jgi:hypothetical protein
LYFLWMEESFFSADHFPVFPLLSCPSFHINTFKWVVFACVVTHFNHNRLVERIVFFKKSRVTQKKGVCFLSE